MITKTELEKAVDECEHLHVSYQNCEKLAVFTQYMVIYTLRKNPKNKKQFILKPLLIITVTVSFL